MRKFTQTKHPLLVGLIVLTSSIPLLGIDACETTSDQDGDGYTTEQGDCDDLCASCFPGASEVCDGLDNSCDGQVDEGLSTTWYLDHDADGHGSATNTQSACAQPVGYVATADDCNDSVSSIYPGAEEACNQLDDNCDGIADSGTPHTLYPDADHDGYGDPLGALSTCSAPTGYLTTGLDCDDTSDSVYPGAAESCDGIDSDCDGKAESSTEQTFYQDQDGDGWGTEALTEVGCLPSPGFAARAGDCDDLNGLKHPFAPERCDALDNDCSGQADDAQYFIDQDQDGFGRSEQPALCTPGAAVAPGRGDCRDSAPTVHPGAGDVPGDALDSDCGGTDQAEPHVGLGSGSYGSLSLALAAAGPGVTLFVGPGLYEEHGLSLSGAPLSLVSTHLASSTHLDGQTQGRILEIASGDGPDTRVDGFTFTRGVAPLEAGALRIADSSPTVIDCDFIANHVLGDVSTGTEGQGGAILLQDSDAILDALRFSGNAVGSCEQVSSSVYSHTESPDGYSTTDTTTDTVATVCFGGQGGAVAIRSGQPSLKDVSFIDNHVEGEGGALYVQDASPTLLSVHFADNSAHSACTTTTKDVDTLDSSGPYSSETTATTTYSQSCTRVARGGAVALAGGTLTLEDVQLIHNEALPSCVQVGSDYSNTNAYGDYYVSHSRQPSCTPTLGGGLSAQASSLGSSTLEGQGLLFQNNSASQGGAVAAKGGTFTLTEADFSTNQASVEVLSNTYQSLDTENGEQLLFGGLGGAFYLEGGSATLIGLSMMDNEADLSGGGMYAQSVSLSLAHGLLVGQSALGQLETTFYSGDGPITSSSHVVGGKGGALFVQGGQLSLHHTRIEDSQALSGAGLYCAAPATLDHVLLARGTARGSESNSYYSQTGSTNDTNTPLGGRGAGMTLEGASATLTFVILAANVAEDNTSSTTTASPWGPETTYEITDAGLGGGVYVVNSSTGTASLNLSHSMLTHNTGLGLAVASGTATPGYTLFYAQPGEAAHALSSLPATNLEADPRFLLSDGAGLPLDYHLASTSPAINAGSSSLADVDGSRTDLGIYGGSTGNAFDLDADGLPDYFWPGAWSTPPVGFSASRYDCDDLDETVQSCP